MIFNEIYSTYFNVVAKILRKAVEKPITINELRCIVNEYAYGESMLQLEPMLKEGKWQLLQEDGTSVLNHAPNMPLTLLQKRWLKAVAGDTRIRLFDNSWPELEGVEPLFNLTDYHVFDKYNDGDPYDDAIYRENFQTILKAVRGQKLLQVRMCSNKGNPVTMLILPQRLEYSEKDDKFRLLGQVGNHENTINIARIKHCELWQGAFTPPQLEPQLTEQATVVFELEDRRNALERVLLHFAHFQKVTERLAGERYRCSITYDVADEKEMVIRILSFGPMVKVVAPDNFVKLIRERLLKQKSCGL